MGIRSFKDYFIEYEEFYCAVLELARMENNLLGQEPSFEEAKKYHKLKDGILSQCPKGTSIEDLVGLVVVGELKNKKGKR